MKRFPTSVALALGLLLAASCETTAPPVPADALVQVDELARVLADSTAVHPVLIHAGFEPLYRSGHIPGSRYVGAGNQPAGLENLRKLLKTLPPEAPVVIYCGCCPWQDCPNMRPAYHAAKSAGHANVRVLQIAKNLESDWTAKDLPTEKGKI